MKLKLEEVVITNVKPLIIGDRVCVDTCTKMKKGYGMLVGNFSKALFLVHSESVSNPYVGQRPFRVNAGAVHSYVLAKEKKTKYLSEISAGVEVLMVDYKGNAKEVVVGRSKTEKRPLMLIEAMYKKEKVSIILQNAETVRLTDPEGKPVSITKLNNKSKVLAYVGEKGRHFGMAIDETIIEK